MINFLKLLLSILVGLFIVAALLFCIYLVYMMLRLVGILFVVGLVSWGVYEYLKK